MTILIHLPRIYIAKGRRPKAHSLLEGECMWGGADHSMCVEGVEYLGYEFIPQGDKYYSKSNKSIGQLIDELLAEED